MTLTPGEVFSAADLMRAEFPEPKWAVPGLLAEGLNLLAGAPKMGKSWQALGIGIAVASGGRAFGKIPVAKGEVLYLALEDSPRRLQERLEMLVGDDPVPDSLYFDTTWPPINEGGSEEIDLWLSRHPDARLIVVDVFAKVRELGRTNLDRYNADYLAMEPLGRIAKRHSIAVLVLHHTRKADASDFLDTVSGTQGLAGAADAVLVLRRARGDADAELQVTGRDVEERRLALRFDQFVGSWTLLGDAEEFAMSETRRLILRALRRSREALTPKVLAEVTGKSHDSIRQTVRRMVSVRQIIEAGDGTYSTPGVTPSLPSLGHSLQDGPSDSVTEVTGVDTPPEEPKETGQQGTGLLERFTYNGETGECVACGFPCVPMEIATGRRIHPACIGREEAS